MGADRLSDRVQLASLHRRYKHWLDEQGEHVEKDARHAIESDLRRTTGKLPTPVVLTVLCFPTIVGVGAVVWSISIDRSQPFVLYGVVAVSVVVSYLALVVARRRAAAVARTAIVRLDGLLPPEPVGHPVDSAVVGLPHRVPVAAESGQPFGDRDSVVQFLGPPMTRRVCRGIGITVSLVLLLAISEPGEGGNAGRVVFLVMMILAIAGTWRGWPLGTLEVDRAGLRAYGSLRRWHWAWSELDHVSVRTGSLHQPLMVHRRDGKVIRLAAIDGRTRQPGANWLEVAADRINDRIRNDEADAAHERL